MENIKYFQHRVRACILIFIVLSWAVGCKSSQPAKGDKIVLDSAPVNAKYSKLLATLGEIKLSAKDIEPLGKLLRISWFHTWDRVYNITIDLRPPGAFARYTIARGGMMSDNNSVVFQDFRALSTDQLNFSELESLISQLDKYKMSGPQELSGGGPELFVEFLDNQKEIIINRDTLQVFDSEFRQHAKEQGVSINYDLIEDENRLLLCLIRYVGNYFDLDNDFFLQQFGEGVRKELENNP